MQATELRIGNFVSLNEGHIEFPLTEIRFQRVISGYYEVAPIPLTEEWLVKFGFIKGKENFGLNTYRLDDFLIESTKDGVRWHIVINDCGECGGTIIKVYYVHRLQNLYFELKNKELIKKQ